MAFRPAIDKGAVEAALKYGEDVRKASMFCVECGAEGPVYEGLCSRCFAKKHPVVEPPTSLDVPRCQACGAFHFRAGWSDADLDGAILRVLRERVAVLPPYGRVSFTHVARPEDATNYFVTVKAMGHVGELERVQDFHVRLRVKPSLCDKCQKQGGRYYEGILQVRADGRELAPEEGQAVRALVVARADRKQEKGREFVSRIEEVDGGLDFYVSTNSLGARLAREVSEAFGGTVSASPKLFGQREGKEVYRVTSLVRLPAFRVGEVVRHKDTLSEVLALRPFVELRDLESGETRRYRSRDLRGVRRVDSERFKAELRLDAKGRGVVTHPRSGEEREVRTRGKRTPGHAAIVWTADGAYVSAIAEDASKS